MSNILNSEAIELIKSFEGMRTDAYQDSVGVWTIGYGHTSAAGPPAVKRGMTITPNEALGLLVNDLRKYEKMVQDAVKVGLTDNQYGALVSFTYNLGPGNLRSSTLLKKVNAGDFAGAANEFAKWNKAGGKALAGLTRRRAAEAALFRKPEVVVRVTPAPVQPAPVPTPVVTPAPSPAPTPTPAPVPTPVQPTKHSIFNAIITAIVLIGSAIAAFMGLR